MNTITIRSTCKSIRSELNAKSRGLKEEKLKADAAEFEKLQKKKELDKTVKNIEVVKKPKITAY